MIISKSGLENESYMHHFSSKEGGRNMLTITLSLVDLKWVRKGVTRTNVMRTKARYILLLFILFSVQLLFKAPLIVRTNTPHVLGLASHPEPIILDDFSEFFLNTDDRNIESSNRIHRLDISMIESFPSQTRYESYLLTTEKWGNIYEFTLNVSLMFEYRGVYLDKVLVELSSRYSERDYYSKTPPTFAEQHFPLASCIVSDNRTLNDGVIQTLGYPDDTIEVFQIDNNNILTEDYHYTNILLFQMKRTKGILSCTIRNGSNNNTLLSHEWNASVSKPLNYILLGYFIEPNEFTEYAHVNFFNFRALLSPPARPPSFNSFRLFLFSVTLGLLVILIYWNKKRK